MSAGRKAYMICTNRSWTALGGLRDTEITHCNDAAAELHGYGSARALCGKRLSEIQPEEPRKALQCQHLLREHGYPTDTGYCTIVQAEDGEVIGHRRQLVWRVSDGSGGLSYCVEITRVHELSPVAMPDIALYGLTHEHFEHTCGKLTVQQLKDQVRSGIFELPGTQNLRTILSRCKALSTHFDCTDETGVDLMLSNRVIWTVRGTNAGLVKIRQHCDHCGWEWFTQAVHVDACPQCRRKRVPADQGGLEDDHADLLADPVGD